MSDRRQASSRRFGFTLVELLVVIGIIALLISILLPTLNRARQAAGNVKCLSNLRSIGNLLQIYTNENKSMLPYGTFDADMYPTNKHTDWGLTLAALMNKGNTYTFNASKGSWGVFRDDPAALPVTVDYKTVYSVNPLVFGAREPSYTGNGMIYEWRPLRVGQVKNATMLVFDSPQTGSSSNAAYPTAFSLDNYQAMTNYNAAGGGINDANGIDKGAADNETPIVGYSDDPAVSTTSYRALRFRHERNTAANVLYIDGHAASSRKGELLRKDYRISSKR